MSERELDRSPGIRPTSSLWRLIDAGGRRVLPSVATAVATIVLALPFHVPGAAELQQAACLASVYFWSVYRPLSMPPTVVFGLGLLLDLLGPEPPGIGMLILLGACGTVSRLRIRLLRLGFLAIWLTFAAISFVAFLAQWILTCLLDWQLLPGAPAMLEFGLAAGLYPLAAALLIRAHASIAAPERA